MRYKVDREENVPMDINHKAPEFTLPDQNGESISLKDFRGKYVVLYFYPRADTPGCTVEACEFRDAYKRFASQKTVLLGVSPDSSARHDKFIAKLGLPFSLVADENHQIAEAYGVWKEKSMYGRKYMGVERSTFIIGPEGRIRTVFRKVKPAGHAAEVLSALASRTVG